MSDNKKQIVIELHSGGAVSLDDLSNLLGVDKKRLASAASKHMDSKGQIRDLQFLEDFADDMSEFSASFIANLADGRHRMAKDGTQRSIKNIQTKLNTALTMLEDPKILTMFEKNSKGQDKELTMLQDIIKDAKKRAGVAIEKIMEASSGQITEAPKAVDKAPKKKPVKATAELSRYGKKKDIPKEFAAIFEMAEQVEKTASEMQRVQRQTIDSKKNLEKYRNQLKEIKQIEDKMSSLILKLQNVKDGKVKLDKGETIESISKAIEQFEKQLKNNEGKSVKTELETKIALTESQLLELADSFTRNKQNNTRANESFKRHYPKYKTQIAQFRLKQGKNILSEAMQKAKNSEPTLKEDLMELAETLDEAISDAKQTAGTGKLKEQDLSEVVAYVQQLRKKAEAKETPSRITELSELTKIDKELDQMARERANSGKDNSAEVRKLQQQRAKTYKKLQSMIPKEQLRQFASQKKAYKVKKGAGPFSAMPVPTQLDTGFNDDGSQKHKYQIDSSAFFGRESDYEQMSSWFQNQPIISGSGATSGKKKPPSLSRTEAQQLYDQMKQGGKSPIAFRGGEVSREDAKSMYDIHMGGSRGTAFHRLQELVPADKISDKEYIKNLINSDDLSSDDKQLFADLRNSEDSVAKEAKFNQFYSVLQRESALQKNDKAVAHELTVGASLLHNGKRRLLTGTADKVIVGPDGKLAMSDYKTQNSELGAKEIVQQVVYRYLLNLNKDQLGFSEKIEDMYIDHTPFDKDTADRYKITGVTDASESAIIEKVLQESENPTKNSEPWDKFLKQWGVEKKLVTPAVKTGYSTFDGLGFGRGSSAQESEYKEYERVFWEKYGPLITKIVEGDTEAKAEFSAAWQKLIQKGKDTHGAMGLSANQHVSSKFFQENYSRINALLNGDASGFQTSDGQTQNFQIPSVTRAQGTQFHGDWLSKVFREKEKTNQLIKEFPTLSKGEQEQILSSVFAHKDFETGEESGHYRDFGEGKKGAVAATLQANSEAFRAHFRKAIPEVGTLVQKETIGDYTGFTMGGRFLKDFWVQYKDALYRKDNETAEQIKQVMTTAYEQMSESMYELINENLEAASMGHRSYEEDEAIMSRQAEIQEVQNALHTMETVFGQDILEGRSNSDIQSEYWNEMQIFRDIVGGDYHMQSDPTEKIEHRKEHPNNEYQEEYQDSYGENGIPYKDLHSNKVATKADAERAGHVLSQLLDITPRITKFFAKYLKVENERRMAEGRDAISPEQFAKTYLARNNPAMFRDYERGFMLQEEIDKRMKQKQEREGDGFTWTEEDIFNTLVDMLKEERFSFDEETINAMDMYSDLTVHGDPNDHLTDIAKSTFAERQRNIKEGKPIYKDADGDISKTLMGRLASRQSMKGSENYRSASEIKAETLTLEQIQALSPEKQAEYRRTHDWNEVSLEDAISQGIVSEELEERRQEASQGFSVSKEALTQIAEENASQGEAPKALFAIEDKFKRMIASLDSPEMQAIMDEQGIKKGKMVKYLQSKKKEEMLSEILGGNWGQVKKYLSLDSDGKLKLNSEGMSIQNEYFESEGYSDKETDKYFRIFDHLVGPGSAKNFQSSSKLDKDGALRQMFATLSNNDRKNDFEYQDEVRLHNIDQEVAEEKQKMAAMEQEVYDTISAEINKTLQDTIDKIIEQKLAKQKDSMNKTEVREIPGPSKKAYETPSIKTQSSGGAGDVGGQPPSDSGKKGKYSKYGWNDIEKGYFWIKKDGTFSKERVSKEQLTPEEQNRLNSPSDGSSGGIQNSHITSGTNFNPKGKRRKSYMTDDQGHLIGETWEDVKDKVRVDWGKEGRQGFIDKHKNKSEDETIANITKILSRKGYNYTKKDGSLNAAGTQVLEKMLQDIYGKGNVGPSDTSNIHIDRADKIDIDNAVTVNINGGIIKDGSRSSDKGKKDDHTARDNKNASDRASKALDYLREELQLEEALAKIQNDKSKLNERNTLIQQITELKKERELLEHNMSDSELAMYGADAAKLSPQHARRISQIQARQEDKNAAQAAKDAEKAEKDAAKAAKEEAAKIDADAAETQAEKEAASKKNLAESNKLLKQKLGYEKELIKIQARVNKLQEDGTESVQEDMKKLEERIKELQDLVTDTDAKYQTVKEGVTEEEDIESIAREEEEHQRKVKDAERRARWAEEDKKAKATGGEVTVDSSKISKKDKETLREARILQAQLYKAKDGLAITNREAEVLQNKKKNAGTLSGEEQERLGILLDRKSEYQSIVNDLTKKWDNQVYETDAGWQAARLLKQGKEDNFKLIQQGKSMQFIDKNQKQALREYESLLEEILKKEQRLYEIKLQKASSTNKREINALEAEEAILSSQVKLLKQKHEEQKKNPLLQTTGSNGGASPVAGVLEANANFESRQAAMEAKAFSKKKGATSIWHQIGDNFQTSIQRVFNYGAAMKIVQSIPQAFKKIIAVSKELDAVMTDLRIVTGYNRQDAMGLMKTYNGLAKQLGATTQEVAKSADTWLRQGYSIADTNQLITSTMYLAKLGQIESGQASQYLTSMLKGFKLEASEAMSVVDKLVALDKQYAVTAGGVAEALSRTAVSAQMAGVELDKIAAMVTVISDVSQKSADSVGESMKTLFARYGNVKAGVFEDLSDSSGETTENINDIEKVLNSVGIKVRSSSLEFREMDDVLEELADKWIGLTTVEKNAIATAMAGTRQRENFNIMMENYDEILKATETSINANGTAEKGYAAVTESVAYQMNQMKNAWDQLALQMDTNPIFVQLTKWGVDLLEVLPQIIQYVLTFVSITKSKALLGGLKDLGLGTTNALFGTQFGYGDSSKGAKSAGLFNKNGVSKDFLGKETGKIKSTLENILRAIQGKTVRDRGSILGSDSDNYSTYLELSSSDNKKVRKLAKKMDNPLYEMAQQQGVTAEGFEEFEAKMGEMAKVVGEATIKQRKKMQADMNSVVQSKKEAMEKAKARAEQAKADMEFVLASKTATEAEREAAIANEHEARASYEAAQADYNEAQGQQGNLNTLVGKANKKAKINGWKQAGSAALSSGIIGGITSAMGAYATTEGDEEDKKNAATKQGTSTAIGTAIGALGYAIPGWGAIIGPITTSLGGTIGNLIGEKSAEAERERKYAEQNAAKKRAEQGEEALQILQSSNGAIEQMSSMVRTKDDWTTDDEAAMESYIDSVKETLYLDNGLREQFVDNVKALNEGLISTNDPIKGFKQALTVLTEGTEEQAREVMRQLELAKLQREKEELEESQALEDYQNKKKMSETIYAGGKVNDNKGVAGAFKALQAQGLDVYYNEYQDWFTTKFSAGYSTKGKSEGEVYTEVEVIIERLLDYQARNNVDLSEVIESFETKLEGYKGAVAGQKAHTEQLDEIAVKQAFTASDVYMWDAIDIKNASLNEAIDEIADNLTLAGAKVRDKFGVITDEARSMILSELKSDTRYSSLMHTGTQKLNKMLESDSLLSFYIDQLDEAGKNVSNYSDLLSIFTHETDENLKKQQEYAEQLGISVDELRNIVYKTDPENLNKFAQELGFTVDELEEMKHTLGGYTLSDLFAVPEKTIEKYEQLTDLLSTITSMGTMTASTLETIVDKYPELMQGADGSFSMSNVESNILSAFGIGSETAGIQNIYAKQFYEQLKTNDAFYTAFLQQVKDKYSEEKIVDGKVKKVLTEQGYGIIARLGQFSTFTDEALQAIVAEDYRGADGELQYETDETTGEKVLKRQTAIGEGFSDMYNSFIGGLDIEVDLLKDFRKMLGELKIKEYEQEQQNLKDVLEGLQSINAQREKEIELIKAKQQLENAAKEKVLRYREGLGFVYEQDTSKVKEAKEQVDKLEEEMQKSSIQYQIDQLEVQKSTLNALLDNETKSQDLLAQIEENTSVLSIISSGADVDRSKGVSVSVGGANTEINWEGLLADLTKQYGLTNEQILELYKTLNHWGDILTNSMAFEGDVTISANGSLVLGDGTTLTGAFDGTLTSEGGLLSGTLKATTKNEDGTTEDTFVTGTFQLDKDGKLVAVPDTPITISGAAAEGGGTTTINAQQASGSYFEFTSGTATGTLTPADGSNQWSASGTVHFGEDTKLTIASGDVTYTGDMTFSGTDNSFKVEDGSLSGSFGTVGPVDTKLSGSLGVDTDNGGLNLSGTLNAGTDVALGVDYDYYGGVLKPGETGAVEGADGTIRPTLAIDYTWSTDDEGTMKPVLGIDYSISGATQNTEGIWTYDNAAVVSANLQATVNGVSVPIGTSGTTSLGEQTLTWSLKKTDLPDITYDQLFNLKLVELDLSKYISTTATVALDSISTDDVLAIQSTGTTVTNAEDSVQVYLNEQASLDMTAAFQELKDTIKQLHEKDNETNNNGNTPVVDENFEDTTLLEYFDETGADYLNKHGFGEIIYNGTLRGGEGDTAWETNGTWTLPEYLRRADLLKNTTQKTAFSDEGRKALNDLFSHTEEYLFEQVTNEQGEKEDKFTEEAREYLRQVLLREGLDYADVDSAIAYIEKDASEDMLGDAKKGGTVKYTSWGNIFSQTDDIGKSMYNFYEYDKEEIQTLLTSAEGQKQIADNQKVSVQDILSQVDFTGYTFENAGTSTSPKSNEGKFRTVETAVQSLSKQKENSENTQDGESGGEGVEVTTNAAGGVYDEDSIIRVAEYSDSATNPEIVAPQSIIEESLNNTLQKQSKSNQSAQSSAVVASSSLMVGKGRQKQSDDLTQGVKKLTATGENLITSGDSVISTASNAITAVDDLSSTVSLVNTILNNIINKDGTINSEFVSSIVSAAVTATVTTAATAFATAVAEGVASIGNLFADGLRSMWNGVTTTASDAWDGATEVASDVWDGVVSGLKKVGSWFGIVNTAGFNWIGDRTWRKWGHANGTLDAPGGLSVINEPWAGGTEAIVTPNGTITALPSHTGIVPADLTRNLYKLGEVAPNLIKDTYHSSQESLMSAIHNSKMIEDNSISIQKLDAVFQVNENFDFDKFLTEVRGVVSTTKNNR